MRINWQNKQPDNRNKSTSFGSRIRELRYHRGIGIKKLAPELGVDYSYLSRLENEKALPSAEVIDRLSKYFDHNKDELMLLAEKVPQDVMQILREHPRGALTLLRESFSRDGKQS